MGEISYIDAKICNWEERLARLHFLLKEAPDSRACEQLENNIRETDVYLQNLVNMRDKDTIRYCCKSEQKKSTRQIFDVEN